MIAPKYKELAKEYEGRVRFLKVDVQQHNVGVQVRSMPTFHFYFQGNSPPMKSIRLWLLSATLCSSRSPHGCSI